MLISGRQRIGKIRLIKFGWKLAAFRNSRLTCAVVHAASTSAMWTIGQIFLYYQYFMMCCLGGSVISGPLTDTNCHFVSQQQVTPPAKRATRLQAVGHWCTASDHDCGCLRGALQVAVTGLYQASALFSQPGPKCCVQNAASQVYKAAANCCPVTRYIGQQGTEGCNDSVPWWY